MAPIALLWALKLLITSLNILSAFKALRQPPRRRRERPDAETKAGLSAVERSRRRQVKKMLTIWVVWVLYLKVEGLADKTVKYVLPLYEEIKLVVLLSMTVWGSAGAELVFKKVIRPVVKPYERPIDAIGFIAGEVLTLIFAVSLWLPKLLHKRFFTSEEADIPNIMKSLRGPGRPVIAKRIADTIESSQIKVKPNPVPNDDSRNPRKAPAKETSRKPSGSRSTATEAGPSRRLPSASSSRHRPTSSSKPPSPPPHSLYPSLPSLPSTLAPLPLPRSRPTTQAPAPHIMQPSPPHRPTQPPPRPSPSSAAMPPPPTTPAPPGAFSFSRSSSTPRSRPSIPLRDPTALSYEDGDEEINKISVDPPSPPLRPLSHTSPRRSRVNIPIEGQEKAETPRSKALSAIANLSHELDSEHLNGSGLLLSSRTKKSILDAGARDDSNARSNPAGSAGLKRSRSTAKLPVASGSRKKMASATATSTLTSTKRKKRTAVVGDDDDDSDSEEGENDGEDGNETEPTRPLKKVSRISRSSTRSNLGNGSKTRMTTADKGKKREIAPELSSNPATGVGVDDDHQGLNERSKPSRPSTTTTELTRARKVSSSISSNNLSKPSNLPRRITSSSSTRNNIPIVESTSATKDIPAGSNFTPRKKKRVLLNSSNVRDGIVEEIDGVPVVKRKKT